MRARDDTIPLTKHLKTAAIVTWYFSLGIEWNLGAVNMKTVK